jgi:mono/diheme cytochrome c family protein
MKSFLLLFAGSLLVVAVAAGNAGLLRAQTQSPTPAAAPAAPVVAPATAPAPAAAPSEPVNYPKNTVKPTAESQAKAKSVYNIDCAMCHGDNGNGKTDLATSMSLTLADWTDPKSLENHEDGELFNVIRNGKGDKMPPEAKGRATDSEVWNLIFYIRNFSKGQAAAPAAAPATAESH